MNNGSIGIFDSGIGGLTVAREIVRQLPDEGIIYLGDTARVPYGTRSKEIITKFALELVEYLLKRNVKCLVVACNTISSVALSEIEKVSPVPVMGVVKPAAKKAVSVIKNNKIGVISTVDTIQSKAYEKEIKKIDPEIEVFSVACPLFVPLVEEGLQNHQAAKLLANDYLKSIIEADVDTLVLGCTHYPLLIDVIAETVGSKVTLIDSAKPTTEELIRILQEKNLLSDGNNPTHEFLVTDAPDRVQKVANRFFGSAYKFSCQLVSISCAHK